MSSLSRTIAQAETTPAEAPAGAAQAAPGISQFIPLAVIMVVFYFLMLRPQKKRAEQEKDFLGKLAKGQEVYTKSGILGAIVGLTDKVVTLEVSENTKIKVLRSQIAGDSKVLLTPKA